MSLELVPMVSWWMWTATQAAASETRSYNLHLLAPSNESFLVLPALVFGVGGAPLLVISEVCFSKKMLIRTAIETLLIRSL